MQTNLYPVAKQGWKFLFSSISLFLVFFILDFDLLAFMTFILSICFFVLFRNPERELPITNGNAFLSPSDGTVISIEEFKNESFKYKLVIEGSYFDVGLLRASTNQKLEKIKKRNGTRVSMQSPLFSDLNEYMSLDFTDESNNKFTIEYQLKNSFIPLNINLIEGEKMTQASRYGLMLNGLTTIYLPENFELKAIVGNEIKASSFIVGYFS